MIRILFAIALTAVTSLCAAQGVGGIGTITVIDRDTGTALVPHLYKGEFWVAGVPGARYAIEIHNRLGERLLVVTSVDGVDVISGETAAWDQAGYVFDPGEHYQIDGWRKSDTDVAAFTFTSMPNSYAALTGRPANVGVIGIAMFRERPPQLSAAARDRLLEESLGETRASPTPAAPALPSSALNAASAGVLAEATDSAVVVTGARIRPSPPTSPNPEAKLGTGHGEREYSYVSHTEFIRLQPRPNELIRIRYDSVENLVAMGIIRRPAPLPEPPAANPFPDSQDPQYVPDPP
jgi:hypothetical protein